MPDPKYIPPSDSRCLIEGLIPDEILSYIFRLGAQAQMEDDEWFIEEDDDNEDFSDINTEEEIGELEADGDVDEDDAGNLTQLYDATDPKEQNSMWSLPFQVRVTHVCRRWRQTAIDLPLLWNTVAFSDQPPYEESRLWIARSKDCPLNINIDLFAYPKEADQPGQEGQAAQETETAEPEDTGDSYDPDPTKEGMERLNAVFDIALPEVHRWQSLDLSTTNFEQMHQALTRLASCPAKPGAPLLRTLSLYCDEDTGYERFLQGEYKTPKLLFGGNAPKLEQLGLWSTHFDWSLLLPRPTRLRLLTHQSSASPGDTSNLRELELAFHALDVRPTFEQFAAIVSHAPRLESLKLSCSGPYFSQEQPTTRDRLIIPSLNTLVLGSQDETYAIKLIRSLYVPNLTSLCLDLADSSFSDFVRCLVEPVKLPLSMELEAHTIEMSRPLEPGEEAQNATKPSSILSNLTFLKLSDLMCEDDCVRLVYENAPRIEKLYLNMKFLPDPFFTLLISNTARLWEEMTPEVVNDIVNSARKNPPLLPQLTSLTVGGVDGDAIRTMVTARKAARLPLRELNVDYLSKVEPEDREFIRQNVEDAQYVILSDEELFADEEDGDEDEEWEDDANADLGGGDDEGVEAAENAQQNGDLPH